jgi:hypothetical protein
MEMKPFAVVAALFLAAMSARAQQRVFVSAALGDDMNACSVAAPCRSFAKAITVVTAGGEILVLDSGGYGAVTIPLPVSIVSPLGIEGSITQSTSGQSGVVVSAPGGFVLLRGLSIFGSGSGANGILISAAAAVSIQSCSVSGFASQGIEVDVTSSCFLSATGTSSTLNGSNGIHLTAAAVDQAIFEIDHCRLDNNAFAGIDLGDGTRGTLRDSVANNNAQYGIGVGTHTGGETALIAVENCTITQNGVGIGAAGTGVETARVSNTIVAHNVTGVTNFGQANAHLWSRSNNSVVDNGTDGSFTDYFFAK